MRYFTSDWHLNHVAVIGFCNRGFPDVETMNREIIARHNTVVQPTDIVYNLGDFSFKESIVREVLQQLNGIQHLIAGNHDPCHSCHSKHQRAVIKYLAYGFASVQERIELEIGGRTVMLSHLPFADPDDPDKRYRQFRPTNNGQFLLNGHCHEKWKVKCRQINVGVDQWNFTPVSETTITELMADILEGEQV